MRYVDGYISRVFLGKWSKVIRQKYQKRLSASLLYGYEIQEATLNVIYVSYLTESYILIDKQTNGLIQHKKTVSSKELTSSYLCVFVLWSCTDQLRKAGCSSGRSQFTEKPTSDLNIETVQFPVGLLSTDWDWKLLGTDAFMLPLLAERKTLHSPALLYTSLPVGRALWILDMGLSSNRRRLKRCRKPVYLICVHVFINHVFICYYHAFKSPNANQKIRDAQPDQEAWVYGALGCNPITALQSYCVFSCAVIGL